MNFLKVESFKVSKSRFAGFATRNDFRYELEAQFSKCVIFFVHRVMNLLRIGGLKVSRLRFPFINVESSWFCNA